MALIDSNILQKWESLRPKHARPPELNDGWSRGGCLLGNLQMFSPLCHSSMQPLWWHVRWGVCVWACDIPHQYLPPFPWYNGDPIRAISLRSIYVLMVRDGRDFGWGQGPMDDVINGSMAWVTAFTPAATKAMSGQMTNFSTTVAADMRLAQRDTDQNYYDQQ